MPDIAALIMLTTLGVGLVAVVVDLVAVGLRRPALAGLPLLAMYSVPVAVLPDGVPVVTFIPAAIGFLWLLVTDSVDRVRRFGRRFTGEGRDVDVWEPSPLAAAGRRLGLVGLAIAVLLPLAIPGLSSSLLAALRSDANGTGSGSGPGTTGTTVDLNAYLTNQLLQRDRTIPMIKVSTTDPNPFYLRFGVADVVQNNGFSPRPLSGKPQTDITGFGSAEVPGVIPQDFKANVQVLDGFTMPLAPTYAQLVAVRGLDNNWLWDQTSGVMFSRGPTAQNLEYSFDYDRISYTPEALELAGDLSPDDRTAAVVPNVPEVTTLVTRLVAGKTNEYDKVRAIYDYFTDPVNNFRYSLAAPPAKTSNPIVDFLNSKSGFCVQYAASMTWLVRAAGFPARVAFGFTRGAGAGDNGVYTLTNFNLHAWTEVFFPRYGWVPFDSTPPGTVPGAVQSAWAPDPSKPDQNGATPTPTTTAGANEPQNIPKANGGPDHPGGDTGTGAGLNPWLVGGIVVLAVLIIVAGLPFLRRRSLARRRRTRSGQYIDLDVGAPGAAARSSGATLLVTDPAAVATARRDAHAAWAELHDTMIDFRVDVDEAETPRATAERIASLLGPTSGHRDQARLLGRAEERARYAQAPLRADGLNQALSTVRSALALRATRWERITAVILPRSVLQRWRLAFVNRLAASVAATARARNAVSLANPRRALSRASR